MNQDNPKQNKGRKMLDSGVEWIGQIPEGWGTARIGDVLSETTAKGDPKDPVLSASQSLGVVFQSKLPQRAMSSDENKREGFKRVLSGHFVVSLRTFEGGIEYAWDSGIISPAYTVCIASSSVNHDYLRHLFKSSGFVSGLSVFMKGIRDGQSIPFSNLRTVSISIPPLPEQKAIANYLDHHTSLIDRERELISRKIDLLKEKRRSLIFEVVTGKRTLVEAHSLAGVDDWSDIIGSGPIVAIQTPRAVDPFVKAGRLVDSGVDWIGEIPEGWNTACLKDVACRVARGASTYSKNDEHVPTGNPVLTPGELAGPGETTKPLGTRLQKSIGLAPSGSTAVANIASIGKIRFLEEPCLCNPQVLAYYPETHEKRWFFWAMFGVMGEASRLANATTIPFINSTDLGKIRMPVPLKEEQQDVADFLSQETSLLDREIDLLSRKHDLLGDQRKALIFEAVTGKLEIPA